MPLRHGIPAAYEGRAVQFMVQVEDCVRVLQGCCAAAVCCTMLHTDAVVHTFDEAHGREYRRYAAAPVNIMHLDCTVLGSLVPVLDSRRCTCTCFALLRHYVYTPIRMLISCSFSASSRLEGSACCRASAAQGLGCHPRRISSQAGASKLVMIDTLSMREGGTGA